MTDNEIEILQRRLRVREWEILELREENSKLLGDRLLGKSRAMQRDLKALREENAELRKLISEAIDKPFTFGRQSTIDAWQVQWSIRVKQLLNERI